MAETKTAAEKKAEEAAKAAAEELQEVKNAKVAAEKKAKDLEHKVDELAAALETAEKKAEEAASAKSSEVVTKTVIAEKGVNVRKAPEKGDNILSEIPHGKSLEVAGEEEDGWVPVKVTGYVRAEFLG